MPVPVVVGNWKMNTSIDEAVQLTQEMNEALDAVAGVEKVLCPPFVSLEAVSKVIRHTSIKLGAQNIYYEQKGAFTGEISPTMLGGLCQYVILGHSERRQHTGRNRNRPAYKSQGEGRAGGRTTPRPLRR